mgnify:FL=1
MTKKINESIRVKYMTKVTLRFLKEKGYFGTIINIDRKFDMLRAYVEAIRCHKYDEEVSFNDFVKINGMYDNASMLIPMLVSPIYYPPLTKIRSFLVKEIDYFYFVMKDWCSFCKYNYLGRYSDATKCNMPSLDFSAKWNE